MSTASAAAPSRRPATPAADAARAATPGSRRAFDFLGKRWNGVILGTLERGPGRASPTCGAASARSPTRCCRTGWPSWSRAGLVERTVTDTRPPGVSYALTDAGRDLTPILHALGSWAADALPAARCTPTC